jgi:hypothetical protein
MSWNNVIPAWILAADSVINEYHAGRIDYERAKAKLKELHVPETMLERLNNKEKEQ